MYKFTCTCITQTIYNCTCTCITDLSLDLARVSISQPSPPKTSETNGSENSRQPSVDGLHSPSKPVQKPGIINTCTCTCTCTFVDYNFEIQVKIHMEVIMSYTW